MIDKKKLNDFQNHINYKFRDENTLIQALTTPQFANENNILDYDILEIIGDAVIKLIFILKRYQEGIKSPGIITKLKQQLENDDTLNKIAIKYFRLHEYILKSENQEIEGTKILADVFEAICGAIFLDSDRKLEFVEKNIINKFYNDWSILTNESSIFHKNMLLEYLQSQLRFTPIINVKFVSSGLINKPIWIAKTPSIFTPEHKKLKILNKYIKNLKSKESKTKKEAEQDLFAKILKILKKNL
ncbi:MAG: ribonuclease III family protein [Candidatus Lokiarchaeota archaeon]|nr:ribonuclease III family protein [Candidatus Lokiarchaeota archaeon]